MGSCCTGCGCLLITDDHAEQHGKSFRRYQYRRYNMEFPPFSRSLLAIGYERKESGCGCALVEQLVLPTCETAGQWLRYLFALPAVVVNILFS